MAQLLQYCGLPPEKVMAETDGLADNHLYFDARWLAEPGCFKQMWELEEELLAYGGDLSSDEALDYFCDSESYALGLDNFVGSAVLALAKAGAVPCSSCSGGAGHSEEHPLVAFWCQRDVLPIIEAAAKASDVEICGIEGQYPSLMVWTPNDVLLLRRFAKLLFESLR
jgi:hypothetical protein